MNPELKLKWLSALRSGKYPQVQSRLRRSGGYCCLGVLCEVSGVGEWGEEQGTFYYATDDGGICGYNLPSSSESPLKMEIELQNQLTTLNDYERLSFEQIANWIEKNL